jgi:hypothetical protein
MAAAQPPAQGLFEAARQLELSKIPLFFGEPSKDHFTPETWLYRLEQARVIGNWNDANTAIYMNMSFRENAIKWRDGLHDMGVNTNDWATLRAAFLRFYAPGATIRSCVANIDIKQGVSESVRDYGPRVARVIHDIRQTVAAYQFPDPLFAPAITGLQGYDALAPDAIQQAHRQIVQIGEQRVADLISIHIFVAGLKPYLRDKCVTRVFNTYYEAYTHATSLEHNMSDPKRAAHVSEVDGVDPPSDTEVDELEAQINRLRARVRTKQNRQQPGRTRPNTNNTSGTGARRDYSSYTCRYCNIKGHIQSQCRKRLAAGAPLVDNQGKTLRSVHETQGADMTGAVTGSAPPAQTGTTVTGAPQLFNPFQQEGGINQLFANHHLNFY